MSNGVMNTFRFVVVLSFAMSCLVLAQDSKTAPESSIPISTQVLLDGVKRPESKTVIKAVLMVVCRKDNSKGTGFILSPGWMIVTNNHVVKTCSAGELEITASATNDPIKLVDVKPDRNRDLAILCTDKALPFGLVLAGGEHPAIETEVETWGYPLSYENRAPILSRGYVAGYSRDLMPAERGGTGVPVNRLIINGAFNPGNSGGPLIDRTTGKVIGVVVEKWTLWSPLIESAINGFAHPRAMMGGTFSRKDASGKVVGVSDEEVISDVLKEFYQQSQVMIGNAISISELNDFIKTKRGEEPLCGTHP
jgi:S1-C subfamily serine protease